MADVVSLTHTFGGLSSPVPLNYLDANYTDITDAIASLNTFSNYLVDTGAANAYIVTLGAGLTCSLAAGLTVQFKAANVNTADSTLNVNGTGAKNILNANGAALGPGQIPASAIISVMYDGTQYLLLGATTGYGTFAPIDSSGAALAFTSANGYWTQTGRLFTAVAALTYPATADGSAARIGGFPIASAALTGNIAVGAMYVTGVGPGDLVVVNQAGVTYVELRVSSGGATVANSAMSTGSVRFSISYIV
jgi:hypothetical protein